MVRHFLVNLYRHIRGARFHFITIISGLAIGMAVTMLVLMYVNTEQGYDTHHENAGALFRVDTILEMEGKVDRTAKSGLNTGEALMEFFPEIIDHTQFLNMQKQTVRVGEDLFPSDKIVYADSNAMTFFNYAFLHGDPKGSLTGPNKVVLSSSVASQFFGSPDRAIGRSIEINRNDYLVTGVYDERAGLTHIPYNIFLSLASLPQEYLQMRNREFMWLTTFNYVRVGPNVQYSDLQKELARFNESHLVPYVEKNGVNGSITFELEPVSGIHLNNTLRFDFPGAVDPAHLRIFSVIALLTLFIALVNYINLTTARISKRIKEIGIKKAIGASRKSLFLQFVFETYVSVGFSFLLAVVAVYFLIPVLNDLTGRSFMIAELFEGQGLVVIVISLLVFGLLASIYPASLLTSFGTMNALSGAKRSSGTSRLERMINPTAIRKILVTLQFSISIFLIIGTIIIFSQFKYIQSVSLGFNKEQILVVDIPSDTAVSNHLDVVKNKFFEVSSVQDISVTSSVPGTDHGALTMNVSQSGGSEIKVINTYMVDDKFANVLGLELSAGRFFSREYSTDPAQAFIINEAAARFLGWEDDPIGKLVESPLGQKGGVVGVVRDFNYKSLHSVIEPIILMNTVNSQGYLMVKLSSANLSAAVDQLGDVWRSLHTGHPYEYFFLDDKFQSQYQKEERLLKMFTYLAILAIFISCLGLIGLAIFTNELRVKEIGIRKTLGASTNQIVVLLSANFLLLILFANMIAWPVSYFVVQSWLNEFAYRVDFGGLPFIAGALIAFAIAAATVGYFAIQASRRSIVKALKQD